MLATIAACGNGPKPLAPAGSAAYGVIPPANPVAITPEYRIGPLDVLSLKIFKEPDFDNDKLDVDADGMVAIPLIGEVEAKGKTARELAELIAARLNAHYLINPQVSIAVVDAATQRVTVDGEVNKAGVYPIRGRSSLIQAVALAGGTSQYAKLDQVLVFRTIDGKPAVARFDLASIRAGLAPDPELLGNDMVVVGYSSAERIRTDIMQIIPSAAGIFVTLLNNRTL